MPELPEVEILVRHLDPVLLGKRIESVTVHHARSVRPSVPSDFERALVGGVFGHTTRRAKFLCFELLTSKGISTQWMGHLGMTGRMFLQPKDRPLPRHTTVNMDLGTQCFVFEDPRKFGRMTLDTSSLAEVGPEPLSEALRAEVFLSVLKKSRQSIKTRLLDQRVIAGVGNIYASESLFRAGIAPQRPCHRLRLQEVERLLTAIREVLEQAIAVGSSIPLDFQSGADGLFYYGSERDSASSSNAEPKERFEVYDREGEACRRCGSIIRRLVQGQRSTFYCPGCQKAGA